ncbi:hypothetical protein ACK3TF_004733 [Chlorella vulgaris]
MATEGTPKPVTSCSATAAGCEGAGPVKSITSSYGQRGSTTHTVAAVLTPDGSRLYKVRGSGREVREFLRGLGLALDSGAAVVRQARVTALADSASPAEFACCIAPCLQHQLAFTLLYLPLSLPASRWNEEVAAASQELRRTRMAVVDVQASLAALVGGGAVEVAAEEVRLLTEQQQRRRAPEKLAAVMAADARQQSAARGQLAAELAACQQAQHAVAADLEQASSAAAVAALLVSQTAEERQLRAALSAAELAPTPLQQRLESSSPSCRLSSSELKRLRNEKAALLRHQPLIVLCCLAPKQSCSSSCTNSGSAAQRLEQAGQLEAGTLAARLRTAVGSGGGGRQPAAAPAALCSNLAYVEALQVLAGRELGRVVAGSTESAAALMAAGGQAPRLGWLHTQQQRRAAQHFPDGQVVLPLDLLCCEEAHRPALLRAFGAHVIAASDAVAEQLASRWALTVAFLLNLAAARSVRPTGRITGHSNRQPQRLVVPGGRTLLAVPPAATPDVGDSAEAPMETASQGAPHTGSVSWFAWPDAARYMLFCHQRWNRDLSYLLPRVNERSAEHLASLGTFEERNTLVEQAYLKKLQTVSENYDKTINNVRLMIVMKKVVLASLSFAASISVMALGMLYVVKHSS